MMAPIVSSLSRVEMMRYNYHLEHTCVLNYLKSIDDSVARLLVRTQSDLDLYDLMMSREANFRTSDLSSVWRSSNPWIYVRRLFGAGDAAVLPRIAAEEPILHLVTHFLSGISRPLFDAFGNDLRIVQVVRHPLYMVKQWYTWIPRAESDPRFFFIRIEHEGESMPWFTAGWGDLYRNSNRMDRTIYAIEKQWRLGQKLLERLSSEERDRMLIVPFEQFVVDPDPFMNELEKMLGSKITRRTRRMMKKQQVPREKWADGIDIDIYRQYGWEPSEKDSDETQELAKRRAFVASEATPEALDVLDRFSAEYESEYLDS